jgi:DNA-binding NarL/FixJ family response regulator
MRVFLADDQAAVRSALRRLLKEEPGLSVVGEAARAEDLLAQASAARPDAVLLDWELPGLPTAYDRTEQTRGHLLASLQALDTHPKVIALSGRLEARQAALAAGADAFVSKGDPQEQLLTALRTINQAVQTTHHSAYASKP